MIEEPTVALLDAIRQLTQARDRDLLVRRFVCDQTKPGICAALEQRPDEFGRPVHRARARLRRVIGHTEIPETA